MRLAPSTRSALRWTLGILAVLLFSLLGFQAACYGLDRKDLPLDPDTFSTVAFGLTMMFGIGMSILRRSPGPDPGRGGEMGAYRGPAPRR